MVGKVFGLEILGQFLGIHDSGFTLENVAVHAGELKEQFTDLLKILDKQINAPNQDTLSCTHVLPEVYAQHDDRHDRAAHVGRKPFQLIQALVIPEEIEWLLDFVHNGAENQAFNSENDDCCDITDGVEYALRDMVLGAIKLFVLAKHDPI